MWVCPVTKASDWVWTWRVSKRKRNWEKKRPAKVCVCVRGRLVIPGSSAPSGPAWWRHVPSTHRDNDEVEKWESASDGVSWGVGYRTVCIQLPPPHLVGRADGTPGGRRRADLRKSFSFSTAMCRRVSFLSPSFLSLSASLIILLVAPEGGSGWPGRELPFEVSLFQRRRRLLLLL